MAFRSAAQWGSAAGAAEVAEQSRRSWRGRSSSQAIPAAGRCWLPAAPLRVLGDLCTARARSEQRAGEAAAQRGLRSRAPNSDGVFSRASLAARLESICAEVRRAVATRQLLVDALAAFAARLHGDPLEVEPLLRPELAPDRGSRPSGTSSSEAIRTACSISVVTGEVSPRSGAAQLALHVDPADAA